MAAPGTHSFELYDATTKMRIEHHTVTTQPGGVHIVSGQYIQTLHGTLNTFVAEPVSISVVPDTDRHGFTVYSTSDSPLLVSVLIIGDV